MSDINEAFLEACANQHVSLPSLLRAQFYGNESDDLSMEGYESPILRALRVAEGMLTYGARRPITEELCDIERLPEDVPARMLGQLINVSHGLACGGKAAYVVQDDAPSGHGTCTEVERQWTRTNEVLGG